MKKKDVIEYFGSVKKTADALKLWPQAVYNWGEEVPKSAQYRIEIVTKGKLKVDKND